MQGSEAHVLAVDQGVCLQDETIDSLSYDDGTMLLLVVKGGVVFAYDLSIDSPGSHEQLAWTYPLPEGPKVTAMRCSLDRRLIAIQRQPSLLELADLTNGTTTTLTSHKNREPILGFFFTEERTAEVVLVTRTGLELCQFGSRGEGPLRHGVRVVDRIKININWYRYTHDTRCCLVGTGPPGGTYIQAWQFVSSGMVHLPPFVVGAGPTSTGVSSLASRALGALPMPLPPSPMALPPGLLNAFAGAAPLRHDAYPVDHLSLRGNGNYTDFGSSGDCSSIRLIKMYGRVYCTYINMAQSRLELYRFYTDTVVLQHSYEIFSKAVELSVVDNILVIHHRDSAVALLFDVNADTSEPISLPLPLGLMPPCHPAVLGVTAPPSAAHQDQANPGAKQGDANPSGSAGSLASMDVALCKQHILSCEEVQDWSFCPPNVAISQSGQVAYRLFLDLRSLVDSSSGDTALLAGFLQRRRPPTCSQLRAEAPKELLLTVVRSALQERRTPMHVLRTMFDNLSKAWADVCNAGRVAPSTVASLVSPSDLATRVFQWLHDEELLDVPFLSAALSEYCASAEAYGLPPLPHLQALATELLLLQAQPDQAAQATYLVLPDANTASVLAAGTAAASIGSSSKSTAGLPPPPTLSSMTATIVAMACFSEVVDKLEQDGGNSAAAAATARNLRTKVALLAAGTCTNSDAGPGVSGGVSSGSAGVGKVPAEQHVRWLLSKGSVLQAAKAAKRMGVIWGTAAPAAGSSLTPTPGPSTSVHPVEFLTAAAKTRDIRIFAAVYRLFRVQLQRTYPRLESAKVQLGFRAL